MYTVLVIRSARPPARLPQSYNIIPPNQLLLVGGVWCGAMVEALAKAAVGEAPQADPSDAAR